MSILEKARTNHEDIESIVEAASKLLLNRYDNKLDSSVDHCIDFLVQEIQTLASTLKVTRSGTGSFSTENSTSKTSEGTSDIWHNFYMQIRRSKEAARVRSEEFTGTSDVISWCEAATRYAREKQSRSPPAEFHGRFLDMIHPHHKYLNIKRLRDHTIKSFLQNRWAKVVDSMGGAIEFKDYDTFAATESAKFRDVDYITWLQNLSRFELIPRYVKYKQPDYLDYLKSCAEYLSDFISRNRPLSDIRDLLIDRKASLRENFVEKNIHGWESFTHELPFFAKETGRLFASENTFRSHLQSKDFAKHNERYAKLSEKEKIDLITLSQDTDFAIASLEDEIVFLYDFLRTTFEDTIDHVTRKQARTAREIEEELKSIHVGEGGEQTINHDDSSQSSSGGEEMDLNDRAIYNPLNLPLGFDGKPIPYWMYKLHGLAHEFKCEICGNASYWGRRAFEKHFSEWRHVNGLKALRIPNSAHFHGVTGIEDAIRLHEKMRKDSSLSIFNAEREMECEDGMGNVMSYRTYQDLMRQGML